MPLIRFEQLPDAARLWVFAASRRLTDQETAPFLDATDVFLVAWTAHKVPLATARELRHDQFIFVAVDESAAGASGCSIDALVRFMRDAERGLGIRLTDNGAVWFRASNRDVACTSREGFRQLAEQGSVGLDTIVFDNTIQTVGALRDGRWELPANRAWHRRAFFSKETPQNAR